MSWTIESIPGKPVRRTDDGRTALPLRLSKDGAHAVDAEAILTPGEAAQLHAALSRVLVGEGEAGCSLTDTTRRLETCVRCENQTDQPVPTAFILQANSGPGWTQYQCANPCAWRTFLDHVEGCEWCSRALNSAQRCEYGRKLHHDIQEWDRHTKRAAPSRISPPLGTVTARGPQ